MTAHPPRAQASASPGDGFLARLIRDRCVAVGAEAGAVFRIRLTTIAGDDDDQGVEGDADLLAAHPAILPGAELPGWVEIAANAASRRVRSGERTPAASVIDATGDDDPGAVVRWIVSVPLRLGVGEAPSAVAAFLVCSSRDSIAGAIGALAPVAARFEAHERDLTAAPLSPVERMNNAVAPLLAANAQERFFGAAIAVCNEIESTIGAHRVSVGFVRGRDIRLGAISHTEKIVRTMRVVRDIENAMEECLDQDREVVTPAPPESVAVDRAAGELSRHHGPSSVCVVPLRRGGEPIGALCIERAPERPLGADEIESVRLACELVTPRLHELFERDRWIGARASASVRRSAGAWLGPTHTWAKLLAIAGFALLAFLTLARGTDRVSAPFALQTIERRVAPAPFDGFLESRTAQIGDVVRAGDTLATLDSSALLLERAEAAASLGGFTGEADRARGAGKTADALIAEARAREMQAAVDLLGWRIDRAIIRAPIDGVVVQGDLDAIIGAPVRAGDTLFVVAPIGALRAELAVDASRIADVRVGATGELATTADPSARVAFTVTRIDPIAVEGEQRGGGGFRVIAEIEGTPGWLRPGMEGVAKIDAGERRYAHLWSRRLVNWVRMKLWI
jgi:hypothetical protein